LRRSRYSCGAWRTCTPTTSSTCPRAAAAPRFSAPALAAIDAHFTALDLEKEQVQGRKGLEVAAQRARKKLANKVAGLRRQLEDVDGADALRQRADLMLAYAYQVERGASRMTAPSLDGSGEVVIPLDPKAPVPEQANKLYDKARRLEDGRGMAEQRLATAEQQMQRLDRVLAELSEANEHNLDAERAALIDLGLLPAPQRRPAPGARRKEASTPYRRFSSAEGYAMFVGRNNNQNDELTMRFANGNDLWLHVGGGRPGSHVVVRLPRNKTASLETLLDAATLAVHFSKARGEPRVEVIYTFRKHVRKPKGLPAGAVVPSQTKAVTVHADPERLRRLLDSAGDIA